MNESTLERSSVYRRSDDVVCRAVGNESVLVPIRHNVGNLDFVYTLSPVAARIWALLDGTRTVDEVIASICTEYDADADTVAADLAELVRDLTAVSLLDAQP